MVDVILRLFKSLSITSSDLILSMSTPVSMGSPVPHITWDGFVFLSLQHHSGSKSIKYCISISAIYQVQDHPGLYDTGPYRPPHTHILGLDLFNG